MQVCVAEIDQINRLLEKAKFANGAITLPYGRVCRDWRILANAMWSWITRDHDFKIQDVEALLSSAQWGQKVKLAIGSYQPVLFPDREVLEPTVLDQIYRLAKDLLIKNHKITVEAIQKKQRKEWNRALPNQALANVREYMGLPPGTTRKEKKNGRWDKIEAKTRYATELLRDNPEMTNQALREAIKKKYEHSLGDHTVSDLRQYLRDQGVPVRTAMSPGQSDPRQTALSNEIEVLQIPGLTYGISHNLGGGQSFEIGKPEAQSEKIQINTGPYDKLLAVQDLVHWIHEWAQNHGSVDLAIKIQDQQVRGTLVQNGKSVTIEIGGSP